MFCLSTFSVDGQNIDIVKGSASLEWPSSESLESIRKKCEDLAIINGIEKQYGQVIFQGNSTYIKNETKGTKVESSSSFSSISNRLVKGEFVKEISKEFKEPEKKVKIDGNYEIRREVICNITFEAKEKKEAPINIKTFTSSCENEAVKCKTTSFYDGENVYLTINSPNSGFVNIYLDQEIEGVHICNRFLPSENSLLIFEGGVPINADIEYVFFSKNTLIKVEGLKTLPFNVAVAGGKEFSRLFVIFSKKTLNKPSIYEIKVTDEFKKKYPGYELPKGLKTEEFNAWLGNERALNNEIEVKNIDLTFEKFRK